MELQVYQVDGSESGRTIALDTSVFGIDPNDHVLWLDVRRTQASRRQGTHKAKERGEITGSTRKLYRQKGTGMARAGSIKSPLRRSGGRTFGPRPRSYGLRLTKKTRQLARRSALSYKAQGDALRVVEALGFETPDTRQLTDLIEALGLDGQKVLVLTAKNETALYRSSRNLARVKVQEVRNASAEELLDAGVLLCEEEALGVLSDMFAGAPAQAAPAEAADATEAEAAPAEEPAAEAEAADEDVAVAEADEDASVAETDDAPDAEAADAEADEAVAEADDTTEDVAAEVTDAADTEDADTEDAAQEAVPDEADAEDDEKA